MATMHELLISETSKAIKELQKIASESSQPVTVACTSALKLAAQLDFILKDGLIKKNEAHSYWPFVRDFSRKDIIQTIKSLKKVQTDVGRGRAWIRLALNENSIESYFNMFFMDKETVPAYYSKSAMFFDFENMEILLTLFSGLDFVKFNLVLDSPDLDPSTGGVVAFDTKAIMPAQPSTHPLQTQSIPIIPPSMTQPKTKSSSSSSPSLLSDPALNKQKSAGGSPKPVVLAKDMFVQNPEVLDSSIIFSHSQKKTKEGKEPKDPTKKKGTKKKKSKTSVVTIEDSLGTPVSPAIEDGIDRTASKNEEDEEEDEVESLPVSRSVPRSVSPLVAGKSPKSSPKTVRKESKGKPLGEGSPSSLQIVNTPTPNTSHSDQSLTPSTTSAPPQPSMSSSTPSSPSKNMSSEPLPSTSSVFVRSPTTSNTNGPSQPPLTVNTAPSCTKQPSSNVLAPPVSAPSMSQRPASPSIPVSSSSSSSPSKPISAPQQVPKIEKKLTPEEEVEQLLSPFMTTEQHRNYLLVLKLHVFRHDDETLLAFMRCATIEGVVEAVAHVLVTNHALYLLRPATNDNGQRSFDPEVQVVLARIQEIALYPYSVGCVVRYQSGNPQRPLGTFTLLSDKHTLDVFLQGFTRALNTGVARGIKPQIIPDDRVETQIDLFLTDSADGEVLTGLGCAYMAVDPLIIRSVTKAEVAKRGNLYVRERNFLLNVWKSANFFVLSGPNLIQYGEGDVPRAQYDTTAVDFFARPVTDETRSFCFEVGDSQSSLVLAADSLQEMSSWLRVFHTRYSCFNSSLDDPLEFPPEMLLVSLIITPGHLIVTRHNHAKQSFVKIRMVGTDRLSKVQHTSLLPFGCVLVGDEAPIHLSFKSTSARSEFTAALSNAWELLFQVPIEVEEVA